MHGRLLSSPERKLFENFFQKLASEKIPFILLRNYKDFPEYIGHDLDLFIRRRDVHKTASIFRDLVATAGGVVIIIHERDYFIDIRFIIDSSVANAIHLDLYHGAFTWHGLPYLTEEDLLVSACESNGLSVPRPAHEALNIFFTSVLWGSFYKERYQSRIAELLTTVEERMVFERCVQAAFGKQGKPPFDVCSADLQDKSIVKAYAAQLRRAFRWRSFQHSPLATPFRLLRYWFVELVLLLRPKGLVVTVFCLNQTDSDATVESFLARVGELFGGFRSEQWKTEVTSKVSSHSRFSALSRLLQGWLQGWLNWPRLRKRKAQVHLVVLNGCANDWWCNPARYGFGKLPNLLLKLAAGSTPQPDFIFMLADTENVSDQYRNLAKRGGRHFFINSSQPQSAIVDCLETTLVAYLRKREARR